LRAPDIRERHYHSSAPSGARCATWDLGAPRRQARELRGAHNRCGKPGAYVDSITAQLVHRNESAVVHRATDADAPMFGSLRSPKMPPATLLPCGVRGEHDEASRGKPRSRRGKTRRGEHDEGDADETRRDEARREADEQQPTRRDAHRRDEARREADEAAADETRCAPTRRGEQPTRADETRRAADEPNPRVVSRSRKPSRNCPCTVWLT